MLHFAELKDRTFLAVSGEEARGFLQGLLTVDVLKLSADAPRYALLLSPQGRFLHDFFVSADNGRVLLEVDAARMDDLLARLKLYRLRAKVEIAPAVGMAVFALFGGELPEGMKLSGTLFADPRLPQLGSRLYAESEEARAWFASAGVHEAAIAEYDAWRYVLGVPEGKDLVIDRTLPLEAGLEQLHGVDFDKGCYVGQEVTARSLHRAQLRKRMFMVKAENTLPPAGTEILHEGKAVGEMRACAGGTGLAMLQVEAVEKVQKSDGFLTADHVHLQAAYPPWLVVESAGSSTTSWV